jgi:hypothetical protein
MIENKISQKLQKQLSEKHKKEVQIGGVEFDNVALLSRPTVVTMPVTAHYVIGDSTKEKKFKTIFFPSYCPFCGKKIEQK